MNKFNEVKERNLKILEQYVPIVARVHGSNHPEFYEVKKVFEKLDSKIKSNNNELKDDFNKLREITNNYTVPNDVCESFEAVYVMLSELDNSYHN